MANDEDSKEEIEEQIEKGNPTYIMVPRKFVIAWIASFIVMFMMTASSIQWASYIDRRSNQRLCTVIVLSNRASKTYPPQSELIQQIAAAMFRLQKDYDCREK